MEKIAEDVQKSLENQDNWLLERCFSRLSNNYNSYIISDSLEDTHLNFLHLLSGFESSTFILNGIRRLLNFDNVNINHPGSIEGNSGITAAHIAVLNHNSETLKLLVEFDCNLFSCDSFGNNVQDYAKSEKDDYPELLRIVNRSFESWFHQKPLLDVTLNQSEYHNALDSAISPIHSDNEDDYGVQTTVPKLEYFSKDLVFKSSNEFKNDLNWLENKASTSNDDWYVEYLRQKCNNQTRPKEDVKSIRTPLRSKDNSKNKTEIFLHEDKEREIQFLEERTSGTNFLKGEKNRACGSQSSQENDSSNTSIETVIDDLILKMTNAQLREHFRKSGINPGPINDNNKRLYQKKANRALKSSSNEKEKDSCLSNLEPLCKKSLRNYPLDFDKIFQKRFSFNEAMRLEQILVKEFTNEAESIFSGSEAVANKPEITFFVYLLLDPEITNNLPERANLGLENMFFGNGEDKVSPILESLDPCLFVSFITSIFYVGKGKNNRPYQHFYEAFTAKTRKNPITGKESKVVGSKKTSRILDIWSKKRGPISLHCFNGIDSHEAYAREFLIIEALGLSNLTNRISGNSRIKTRLNSRERQTLGTYLLYKAFIMLLLNGERQIKRSNKLRF